MTTPFSVDIPEEIQRIPFSYIEEFFDEHDSVRSLLYFDRKDPYALALLAFIEQKLETHIAHFAPPTWRTFESSYGGTVTTTNLLTLVAFEDELDYLPQNASDVQRRLREEFADACDGKTVDDLLEWAEEYYDLLAETLKKQAGPSPATMHEPEKAPRAARNDDDSLEA